MFSSQHTSKIIMTESDFTYFCSLHILSWLCVYHRLTCGLYWLCNEFKQLHLYKQDRHTVPLNANTLIALSLILYWSSCCHLELNTDWFIIVIISCDLEHLYSMLSAGSMLSWYRLSTYTINLQLPAGRKLFIIYMII